MWDDHDYARNNAGAENPIKNLIRTAYLDFVDEEPSSPRRDQRQRNGIYEHYYLQAGKGSNAIRVHLILLDIRWAWDKKSGNILGDEQWEWLSRILKEDEHRSHFTLITTGVQFNQNEAFSIQTWLELKEFWPSHERTRLLGILAQE